MFKSLWHTITSRLALSRGEHRRHAFVEGIDHERRRVMHVLDDMVPDRDPTDISLAATLFWAEGWNAAKEQAIALVGQRPMPQSFYDGPPESIDHISADGDGRTAPGGAIPSRPLLPRGGPGS